MKTLFVCWLLLSSGWAALGQPRPALTQLVAALNQQAVAPLGPYLTPSTRVGPLPPAYTSRALARLLPQLGPIDSLQVVRQVLAGANTRYECALWRRGTAQAGSVVLTPAGTFLELNLPLPSSGPPGPALAPPSRTTPPRVEIPAQVVDGLLVIEAEVDGRRGAFFLDSGAPALLLNQREFAPPAGDTAALAQGSRGVNGGMAGLAHYALQQFACQGLVVRNEEVATFHMASLEKRLGVGKLLGIIGYDLLREYALTLDYRAGRVLLQKPGVAGAGPATGVRVPFQLRGHLPVVAATIEGRPYQLGIDCGAQTNLLDPAAAAALTRQLRHREQVTLRGADAAGSVAGTAIVPRLTLAAGQLTFRHQSTTFADISHLGRVPGSVPLEGLLGYPLLREYRTTIDYVNQQLLFERW
ncbi:MAG: aspartyl protease family protein [Janthinobacterium lividum]